MRYSPYPSPEKGGDEPSEPADPTNPEQPVITGDENIDEGDGDNAENGNGSGKEGELPGTDNGDAGTGTAINAVRLHFARKRAAPRHGNAVIYARKRERVAAPPRPRR